MQPGTAADELALAIELGLATVDEAILWADAAIADMAAPPYEFIELAMARREPAAEVAHLLRAIPGPRDRQIVATALLARLARSVAAGETSPRHAASLLYEMSMRDQLPDGASDEAIGLDDAFSLALEGTCGKTEEATARLMEFLRPHLQPS